MEIQKLFMEREGLINATNSAVNRLNASGIATRADIEKIVQMRGDISTMTSEIDRRMSQPTSEAVYSQPVTDISTLTSDNRAHHGGSYRHGTSEYQREFLNAFRTGFRTVSNLLSEGTGATGGFLVPVEVHDSIVAAMTAENALRQVSKVIRTTSDRKIPILANRPAAQWTGEGEQITVSTATFDQKVLGAYKLTVALDFSNELLQDAAFDLESFAAAEFGRALGRGEEQAYFVGTGSGCPLGIIPTLAADSTTTITTVGSSIAADDIINLVHSLGRPYRKNAVFIGNDSTIAAVRKLKDANQDYLWQPNYAAGEPERLLGYPVYTSAYVPNIAAGAIPLLFGDFSAGFFIGERGDMVFQPLYELNALRDVTTILGKMRVDAVVADTAAIRGLKVKA